MSSEEHRAPEEGIWADELKTERPLDFCVETARGVLLSLFAHTIKHDGARVTGDFGTVLPFIPPIPLFTSTDQLPVRVVIAVEDHGPHRHIYLTCAPGPKHVGRGVASRFQNRCEPLLHHAVSLMDLRLWQPSKLPRPAAPQGTAFGRYQVRDTLGSGGFATVYRAWDPQLQREVALKALYPQFAADGEIRRRFLTEARTLASVTHPNVVAVYDIGEERGEAPSQTLNARPFFTMELIRGRTLAQAISATGGFTLHQALPILRQLAAALDALHGAGIVHRDVKDANVMLAYDSRAMLMDFGIALATGHTRLTVAGGLGTPESAAPEQIKGQAIGPAADIYALGVLTYQMLSGHLPFTGELAHVLYAQANEPPPPLRERCPGLPEQVYQAIDAALAKDPTARPQSAGAFVALLDV